MKTYLHHEGGEFIQLVRKDEHDAEIENWKIVVTVQKQQNDELLERLRERTESHLAASARDVQTIQRQSVLLDRLANTLKAIAWIKETGQRDYSWTGETAFQALASYESAKSNNQPDPLAEAVKRMEEVPISQLIEAYCEGPGTGGIGEACRQVRARLISAAKGEQP